jgi:hypothetical protein
MGRHRCDEFVARHPVDLDKLATKFRQHKIKNYNNAYISVTTDAEREARKSGDPERAIEIFKAGLLRVRIPGSQPFSSAFIPLRITSCFFVASRSRPRSRAATRAAPHSNPRRCTCRRASKPAAPFPSRRRWLKRSS